MQLGGVAQIAAAIATVVLAGVTAVMAKRTHDVAKKTGGLIEASTREAAATEALAIESRTDRQLAWQPQLELTQWNEWEGNFSWEVRNSGGGLAVQVVALGRRIENVGTWYIGRHGDLRPGDKERRQVSFWKKGGGLHAPYEGYASTFDADIVTVVLLCSDILGRRFRFGFVRPPGLSPDDMFLGVLPAEISVITDDHPAHTDWAAEPLIWG